MPVRNKSPDALAVGRKGNSKHTYKVLVPSGSVAVYIYAGILRESNVSIKRIKAVSRGVAAVALVWGIVGGPVFAAGQPQVNVKIRGGINETITTAQFLNPCLDGPDDMGNYSPDMQLAGGASFMGYIGLYFRKDLKAGSYPISSDEAKGKPAGFALVCTMMLNGTNNPACSQYDRHIKGTLKLSHNDDYYSGSFDVTAQDYKGRKIHVVGTFKNMIPAKAKGST